MTRGKNERGESAVEYGLLAAGIAAAIIVPTQILGFTLSGVFENCSAHMEMEAADWAPEDPRWEQAKRCGQ